MPQNQLINYIKEAKAGGLSNEQILRSLLDAGWKLPEVFGVIFESMTDSTIAYWMETNGYTWRSARWSHTQVGRLLKVDVAKLEAYLQGTTTCS